MTVAENYFHQLAGEIPDVVAGKMFGAQCIKTPNGKAAAMFWHDNLVVKLDGEAMSLDGTGFFDPMNGRPMKEWIVVPFEYRDKWKELTELAVIYVHNIPAKVASKKK